MGGPRFLAELPPVWRNREGAGRISETIEPRWSIGGKMAIPFSTTGQWHLDDRGSVTAEYAVLLGVVAVGCSLAVIALGAPLVRMFMAQEVWILLALP